MYVAVCVCIRIQMDKSRIAGIDITVEKASIENGYVELTPEAEQNSWAMIGEDTMVTYICSVYIFMCCSSCWKKSYQTR